MSSVKSIKNLEDISGKRVLLRLDLNVPVEKGVITDDFRIRKSLPTIQHLQNEGARTIIISHVEGKDSTTLRPVFEAIQKYVKVSVFVEDPLGADGQEALQKLGAGEIALCENIRQYEGEKKNDPEFAGRLASLADIYVNEAFSVSHREHASVVGVPKLLPSYAGFQFESEMENLAACMNPEKPFLFILGGAKFDTKLPLVRRFLGIADHIFIGGALANDLFKAKGFETGRSLVSPIAPDLSGILDNPKVLVPADVVVQNDRGEKEIKKPENVSSGDSILDAGPETSARLLKMVQSAESVLWNGPLGNFEDGFIEPTLDLAKTISESGVHSVVGGGDTLAAISSLGINNRFTFVSTGGGAMLDFLGNGTLPGVEVLKR